MGGKCCLSSLQPNESLDSLANLILSLIQAGVTNCFVNLGSDHPSIIEAIVKGQNEKKDSFPKIYTCPNEVRTFEYHFSSPVPSIYPKSYQWIDHDRLYRWWLFLWQMAMPVFRDSRSA